LRDDPASGARTERRQLDFGGLPAAVQREIGIDVELALQRLAAGILEHQHGPAALTDKFERPQRPRTVEFVPQSIFMCETTNNGGMRAFRDGPNRQYRPALPVGARTP